MTEPRKGSLLVIFLAVFIDLLGFGMVLPLLAIYARDFGTNNGMVIGLLVASFSAMQFIFSPMWGRLSDRIGRRPVLMIGLAGSVVFYSLFGLATVWKSLGWLFVSRIGAGICGGDDYHRTSLYRRRYDVGKSRQGHGAGRSRIRSRLHVWPLVRRLGVPGQFGGTAPGTGLRGSPALRLRIGLRVFHAAGIAQSG